MVDQTQQTQRQAERLIDEQQQVVEILSDEEDEQQQEQGQQQDNDEAPDPAPGQQERRQDASSSSSLRDRHQATVISHLKPVDNCAGQPATRAAHQQRHQFDQHEHNNEMAAKTCPQISRQTSINSQQSYSFHRRSSSRRRSSARRRKSGRAGGAGAGQQRQVRFQPIPQSINISSHSSEPDDVSSINHRTQTIGANLSKITMPNCVSNKHMSKMQQQIGKLSRNSRIHLNAAKPFTRKLHHLSHLKFSKIKLKTFNSLAHQLQQTLTSSTSASHQFGPAESKKSSISKLSGAPVLHHHSHATTANKSPQEITATAIKSNSELASKTSDTNNEEDFGWGSDFDEQSVDSSLSSDCTQNLPPHHHITSNSSDNSFANGYLLEIGRPSCDTKAINDVIQDQGISGQFKRLDLSHCHEYKGQDQANGAGYNEAANTAITRTTTTDHLQDDELKLSNGLHDDKFEKICESLQQQATRDNNQIPLSDNNRDNIERLHKRVEELEVDQDHDDEDDEAELRSLEARQGFKQIRDKLKKILDQRLASFERSAANTNEGSSSLASGATSRSCQSRVTATCRSDKTADNDDSSNSSSAATNTSAATTTTTTTTTSTTTTTTTTTTNNNNNNNSNHRQKHQVVVVPVNPNNEFDCQSHCSEASSSSGLDSNHSGHSSQDSGHSTQHSGYSAIGSSAAPTNRGQLLNHDELVVAGAGSVTPSTMASATSPVEAGDKTSNGTSSGMGSLSPTAGCGQSVASGGAVDDERRNRFLQNRLIINSKLESMFKSKSQTTRTSGNKLSGNNNSSPRAQLQLDNNSISPKSVNNNFVHHHRPPSISSNCSSNQSSPSTKSMQLPIDTATRKRLLEQQRQMSLKLKQKPRRKCAIRALNFQQPVVSSLSACNSSVDDHSLTTDTTDNSSSSYSSPSSGCRRHHHHHHHQAGQLVRSGSGQAQTRDSLTKQLSMVCLRQLESAASGQQPGVGEGDGVSAGIGQARQRLQQVLQFSTPNNKTNGTIDELTPTRPKAALSLRQLVKEVIDDCERPNKLSTLTRSILNRSDSLSSERLASTPLPVTSSVTTCGDDEPLLSPGKQLIVTQHHQRPTVTSLSCSSLSARDHSSDEENQPKHLNDHHGHHCHQTPLVKPIGPHNGALMANYRSSSVIMHCSTPRDQQQLYQTRAVPAATDCHLMSSYDGHRSTNDISFSSVGTIDGLEYSRGSGQLSCAANSNNNYNYQDNLAQEAEQQINQNKQLKSSIGAYWKSLRDFSRFKLPKVKLISNLNGQQPQQHHETCSKPASDEYFVIANDMLNMLPSAASELHLPSARDEYANLVAPDEFNFGHHQFADRPRLPEAPSTLAGAWRRRAKRSSLIDSPIVASLASTGGADIIYSPMDMQQRQAFQTAAGQDGSLANHFVTISNRKWKSCHLRTGLMQLAFSHVGGGDEHHHQLNSSIASSSGNSSNGTSKQHLAYLDNSRNFFTDDDN